MNAFDRHVRLINDFVMYYNHGQPVTYQPSKPYKSDNDVLREQYRFIRSDEDDDDSDWAKRLAKKYYDKLFKEYCLADMSRYKEGKVTVYCAKLTSF
jgi:protein FRA10AC1